MLEKYASEFIRSFPHAYMISQFVYDHNGKIIDSIIVETNSIFESLYQIKAEELLGKSASFILDKCCLNHSSLYETLSLQKQTQYQRLYCTELNYLFNMHAFLLEANLFACFFYKVEDSEYILHELTVQKKELEETKATLDFIFNSTQDAMFMAEYKNDNFYYTCINSSYKKCPDFTIMIC